MYAIHATVVRDDGGYTFAAQCPTFFLDENVQGITGEDHATRIARRMFTDMGVPDNDHLYVRAYAV